MLTKKEIEEGFRLLGIETEEKRQPFKEIIKVAQEQKEKTLIFEYATVSNLDWNDRVENTDAQLE